jgi:hypothetical protein
MIKIVKGAEVDGPSEAGGKRHGVFAYHADPELYPLVCGFSRQPLLDACRQLKSLYGVTGTPVGLFREGRDAPDISCPVEAGAAATVKEPDNGVLKFGKYRAFEWKPVDSRPLITVAVIYPARPLEPPLSLRDRRGNQ